MPVKVDIQGKKYGRLTVIKEAGRDKWGQIMWECKCECGNSCFVKGADLRSGNTKSCGCLNAEKYTERIKRQTIGHSNPASIRSEKLSPHNTSGVRGVCPTKRGTWRAYIGYKGQQIFLGEFAKKADAIAARKDGEEKYFKPVLDKVDTNAGKHR